MRKKSERKLQAYERNAITLEELCSALFDDCIHAHTHGLTEHWSAGLDSLPAPVLDNLLAYAAAHPEPRLFCPYPTDPQRRVAEEQAALAAQAALIDRLHEKSR